MRHLNTSRRLAAKIQYASIMHGNVSGRLDSRFGVQGLKIRLREKPGNLRDKLLRTWIHKLIHATFYRVGATLKRALTPDEHR